MTKQITRMAIVLLFGVSAILGCTRSSEPAAQNEANGGSTTAAHDPHDIPLTDAEIEALKSNLASYQDALMKIESYRDTIREAIAAGNPPQAHRPLDELDVVLEHLTTVAREGAIPRSQWESINTSAQQIRELFNQVHAQIDAGEEPDFDAAAGEIEAAIARLKSAQSAG